MALVYKACIDKKHYLNSKYSNEYQSPVISEFSLTIGPGEFVALTGPSGAGKSTLLNIMAGLDTDYTGSICYGNNTHTARVALMFQEHRLMPWLTLQDNIALVVDSKKSDRIERARYWLNEVGLAAYQHYYPNALSGGMLKRAALARAFAFEPDVLLLDEPFSSLDIHTAAEIKERLLLLWEKQSISVLLVTHDINEAVSLADRVVTVSHSPMRVLHSISISQNRPRQLNHPDMSAITKQVSTWIHDQAIQIPPNRQSVG